MNTGYGRSVRKYIDGRQKECQTKGQPCFTGLVLFKAVIPFLTSQHFAMKGVIDPVGTGKQPRLHTLLGTEERQSHNELYSTLGLREIRA